MTTSRSEPGVVTMLEREQVSDLDRAVAATRLLARRDRQLRVARSALEQIADGDGAARRTAALTLAALRSLEDRPVR